MNDGFNTDMSQCPLDTPVLLYGECMMFQYVFVGTLTKYSDEIVRGKCIKGDPEAFFRAAITEWKKI